MPLPRNAIEWGNSQGLRVSKEILEEAHIHIGDSVEVSAKKGSIVISPVKKPPRAYDLRELISRMPVDYEPGAEEWGAPSGRESW